MRAVQQAASRLRLAGEHDLLRDAGQLAVFLISSAGFGQVQRPADQRMPAAGGIGQGDRYLAQRYAAHGAETAALPGLPPGKAPGHPPQQIRQQRGPGILRYRDSSDCRILIVSHKPIMIAAAAPFSRPSA